MYSVWHSLLFSIISEIPKPKQINRLSKIKTMQKKKGYSIFGSDIFLILYCLIKIDDTYYQYVIIFINILFVLVSMFQ